MEAGQLVVSGLAGRTRDEQVNALHGHPIDMGRSPYPLAQHTLLQGIPTNVQVYVQIREDVPTLEREARSEDMSGRYPGSAAACRAGVRAGSRSGVSSGRNAKATPRRA